MLIFTVRGIRNFYESREWNEAANDQQGLMVPLPTKHHPISFAHGFFTLLYLILCPAFSDSVHVVVSISEENPYFLRRSTLMGYETRADGVKNSVVPRRKVCTAGDLESYVV